MTLSLGRIPRPYEIKRDSQHYAYQDDVNDDWSEAWDPPEDGWLLFVPDCGHAAHAIHLPPEAFDWANIPCPKENCRT